MIIEIYDPLHPFTKAALDSYTSKGWLRGSTQLYRSEIICIEDTISEIINVRIDLEKYQHKKKYSKLLKQNEQKFQIVIQPLAIDDEKEALYEQHKPKFKNFIYNNLVHFFGSNKAESLVFDTHEIAVYENEKLIAISFFDLGEVSLVSLLAVYDLNYAKNSLGIYTMLLEIVYAQSLNLKYYHPGYIISGSNSFDYKLKIAEYEFYNWNGEWQTWGELSAQDSNVKHYIRKVAELENTLKAYSKKTKKMYYPFFSVGDIHYSFSSPVFFAFLTDNWEIETQYDEKTGASVIKQILPEDFIGVSYNIQNQLFELTIIEKYAVISFQTMSYGLDILNNDNYCINSLQKIEVLFQASTAKDLIAFGENLAIGYF